jgi:glycosyltransferase involved in cell wall biosynthesis
VTEARLTALMPVKEYHRPYLERAVGSILGQTSPGWRLLVIAEADGVDELVEVLADALADERVGVIVNEGSRLAGALNTGMRHATTEFTGISLADDMWAPEAVEVLTSYIGRFPEVDFFHSSRAVIDELDRRVVFQPVNASFSLQDFERGSPVKHLLCWRRETALAIGGLDETLDSVGPDDYDFPWSMSEAGARFMAVPECLYLYRDHRDSFRLTTHLPRSTHRRALRRMLRKHGVGRLATERTVRRASNGYLRQCLYRSRLDRWLKERLGHNARDGWRDYR